MSYYVRIKEGMPELRDFASNEGSPIVIDALSGIAYYLYKNMVLPIVGGQLIVFAGFSSGFSDGFANGA